MNSQINQNVTNSGVAVNNKIKVISNSDSGEEGTLRYALNLAMKHSGESYIYFDESLKNTSINLAKRLDIIGNNIVIDGGEMGISLSRNHNWDEAEIINENENYRCVLKEPGDKTIMIIVNSNNVKISGLTFDTSIKGDIPTHTLENYQQGVSIDTECFGDAITIFSKNSGSYDDIKIYNNNFSNCPDGCIDVVRPSGVKKSKVFIVGNTFADTNKTMMLGRNDNIPGLLYVELSNNIFKNNTQRQPRIENADVCMKNNTISNWRSYGVGLFSGARVSLIDNELIPGKRQVHGLRIFSDDNVGIYQNGEQSILDISDNFYKINDICNI